MDKLLPDTLFVFISKTLRTRLPISSDDQKTFGVIFYRAITTTTSRVSFCVTHSDAKLREPEPELLALAATAICDTSDGSFAKHRSISHSVSASSTLDKK